MARARLIWKCLSTSQRFFQLQQVAGPLEEFCQLLYPLIVVHSDDWGRMEADGMSVKLIALPGSRRSFEEFQLALAFLEEVGLLSFGEHKGAKFLQVNGFDEYQRGIHKRRPSRFPEIPGKVGKSWEKVGRTDLDLDLDPELIQNRTEEASNKLVSRGEIGAGSNSAKPEGQKPPPPLAVQRPNSQNPHNKPTNIINGAELRRHGSHAWCSWPAKDGLCVPHDIHAEFKGKGEKTDAQMFSWYAETVGRYTGIAVGDDRYVFWRNEFARWVGTVTMPPVPVRHGKGNSSAAAMARVVAKRLAEGKNV